MLLRACCCPWCSAPLWCHCSVAHRSSVGGCWLNPAPAAQDKQTQPPVTEFLQERGVTQCRETGQEVGVRLVRVQRRWRQSSGLSAGLVGSCAAGREQAVCSALPHVCSALLCMLCQGSVPSCSSWEALPSGWGKLAAGEAQGRSECGNHACCSMAQPQHPAGFNSSRSCAGRSKASSVRV